MRRYVASKDLKDAFGDLRIGVYRMLALFTADGSYNDATYLACPMDTRLAGLLDAISVRHQSVPRKRFKAKTIHSRCPPQLKNRGQNA